MDSERTSEFESQAEEEIEKIRTKKRKQPQKVVRKESKKGSMCRRIRRAQTNLKDIALRNRNNSHTKKHRQSNRNKKHLSMSALPKNNSSRAKKLCVARPSLWEHDAPLFDLGISPPTSQPTPPTSQPTVTWLEILAEAVIDAGVATALKFADATSAEPTFTAAEVYKTPEKEKETTKELKENFYHWTTHVVNAHCMILNDIKCPRFQEDIYCMPTDMVLFVLICNRGHWWLWITDVQKKAFYVFDPVNKKKDEIPYLRIKLNKFINMNRVRFIVVANFHSLFVCLSGINNLPDECLHWGGTLHGRRRGRRSRVYQDEWSIYKEGIDAFRLEYGPNILLHKLNKIRDQVIRASEAIRLPKPSTALSNPYCKFTSGDIYSK
ncbi:hypothetical protein AHAS_Ahas12G0157200 [Arachis hypogaea]